MPADKHVQLHAMRAARPSPILHEHHDIFAASEKVSAAHPTSGRQGTTLNSAVDQFDRSDCLHADGLTLSLITGELNAQLLGCQQYYYYLTA